MWRKINKQKDSCAVAFYLTPHQALCKFRRYVDTGVSRVESSPEWLTVK